MQPLGRRSLLFDQSLVQLALFAPPCSPRPVRRKPCPVQPLFAVAVRRSPRPGAVDVRLPQTHDAPGTVTGAGGVGCRLGQSTVESPAVPALSTPAGAPRRRRRRRRGLPSPSPSASEVCASEVCAAEAWTGMSAWAGASLPVVSATAAPGSSLTRRRRRRGVRGVSSPTGAVASSPLPASAATAGRRERPPSRLPPSRLPPSRRPPSRPPPSRRPPSRPPPSRRPLSERPPERGLPPEREVPPRSSSTSAESPARVRSAVGRVPETSVGMSRSA